MIVFICECHDRRLEKLEEEARRVSRNESLEDRQKRALMLKKHQAIMKPVSTSDKKKKKKKKIRQLQC